MSDTKTSGIEISVTPHFVPEQSDPDSGQWLFAYHVVIRNGGKKTVQLLSRHWLITNGEGHSEEVRGPGVVGKQPVLRPGDEFRYSSACPLDTPVGIMSGEYTMVYTESGEEFDADISTFRLAVPGALN